MLHTDNTFYPKIQSEIGINLTSYKYKKVAESKALKVGGKVIEILPNEDIRKKIGGY